MEVVFKEPENEPMFQAYIYSTYYKITTLHVLQDWKYYLGKAVWPRKAYVVVVGREGTEHPPTRGEFADNYAISDFMSMEKIDEWVNKKVKELKGLGAHVVFDSNLSYKMHKALEELSDESHTKRGT